jgi:membrane-associated phospholipid phosphatase
MIPSIASDQKRIWTFPYRAARGKHLTAVLGVVGVAAGMVAVDPHNAPYFRRTGAFRDFNVAFNGRATNYGIIVAPVSVYVAGLIRKDSYQQKTALLAGEAAANATIVTVVLKGATSRLRPKDVPPGDSYSDTWFRSRGNNWLRGRGSFPSGHTSAAFSVATVISRRYPKHRWVPYVAYGLAGVVGFSRVSLSSHFPSDVFMGAALGYTIGRYTVLR